MLSLTEHMLAIEHIGREHMKLTETEEKIIGILAKKGFKTYYDLSRREGISSSTVWKLLNNLTEKGLIEIKKEETFRAFDRKKKLYGLTFKGLITALKTKDVRLHQIEDRVELVLSWVRTFQEIDSIIGLSRDLPEAERIENYRAWENNLTYYMTNMTEEGEKFLRHFDVDYSENHLIFSEFNWKVQTTMLAIAARSGMSEEQARELAQKLKGLRQTLNHTEDPSKSIG
jgi:DNA-binding Lrp family transcriptional regulator